MKQNLTCVECPMGCSIEVETQNGKVLTVTGYTCKRGKVYAENEVVCPKRVLTSTVRAQSGEMIPVRTDVPIPKSELFATMEKLKTLHPVLPVRIGDVLYKDISDGANLIATGNFG